MRPAPVYVIKIVGTTISLAGIAMMYASRITPSRPIARPAGSSHPARVSASDVSPAPT
jgi:hypothetical protein